MLYNLLLKQALGIFEMKILRTFGVIATLGLFSACSDSGSSGGGGTDTSPPPPPATATVQVVHASSNAPAVNVTADGSALFSGVDYKATEVPRTLSAGTTADIGIDAIMPDGTTMNVIDLPAQTFDGDIIYSIFAVGNVGDVGDTALQAVTVERSVFFVPSDTIRASAVHAAAGTSDVDIYVAEPGLDITTLTPINDMTPVAFADTLGPIDLPEGEYQIRVTDAGDTDSIIFDSGPITLDGGVDPIIAAIDNTNAGSDAPISVLLVNRLGVMEVHDILTTAELRVTHAVPDVGEPVDILIDDEIVVPDLDFTEVAGPLAQDAGSYVIQGALNGQVVINGPTVDEDGDDVPPASTTLDNGGYYDAIAVGSVTEDNLGLLTAADNRRRVATAGKLRVIHASPSTDLVDLYVVDSATTDITAEDPLASDIPYLFNSDYMEFAPGTYNIYVTPAGMKDKAISLEGVGLDADGIYTAIARDPVAPGIELGLILLDDAAP
jgi:hypothetical protein